MAIRFSGTSGNYYDTTTGQPTGSTYSYTLFLYPIGTPSRGHAVAHGSTYQALASDSAGTSWGVWDASTYSSAGFDATLLTANTWYMVGVVLSGASNITFYIGPVGGSLSSANATNYSGNTPTELRVGDYTGGGFPCNARVAGFKLWNAALNTTEITNELLQFAPVRTTSLLRYHPWHVAEVTDHSGNGNNFTLTGTITTEADPPVPETAFSLLLNPPPANRARLIRASCF